MIYDALIIGGGFYGCGVALYLRKYVDKVLIVEAENDVLQRASYGNQARVHNGYHYPRSVLTALRSRVNFTRFVNDFEDCIDRDCKTYYAIGRRLSKISAEQFKIFCRRIDAPLEPVSGTIRQLFDRELIEDVFHVTEYLFDAVKVKRKILSSLQRQGIHLKLNCRAVRLSRHASGTLEVTVDLGGAISVVPAKTVFNCTYSRFNEILKASSLPVVPLKHELTELALVDVPAHLQGFGITVMDGPFFSIMPFPPRRCHSLSHVRYTAHCSWDSEKSDGQMARNQCDQLQRMTHYPFMIRDAQRYMPSLRDCKYVSSQWEIKTLLPVSEIDDSRPILFLKHFGLRNLICILGGKIDNVYDMFDELDTMRTEGGLG